MTTDPMSDVAAWDAIATDYDRTNTPSQMWIAEEGLKRAGLEPSMRFLDVGAGSGALAIPAARLGATVLAIDQSTVMIERLQARAAAEGLTVQTRVGDGHTLDLETDSFHIAGSQFGVVLFADVPRALREMVRVVMPGGRVLMNVYGNPGEIEFLGFFVGAVQSVRPAFHGPPMDPLPPPLQLQDPRRLRTVLATAGLRDIQIDTLTETTAFHSGNELWDWIVSSNPIAEAMLSELEITDAERVTIRGALERMVKERAGGEDRALLSNPVHVAVGYK